MTITELQTIIAKTLAQMIDATGLNSIQTYKEAYQIQSLLNAMSRVCSTVQASLAEQFDVGCVENAAQRQIVDVLGKCLQEATPK